MSASNDDIMLEVQALVKQTKAALSDMRRLEKLILDLPEKIRDQVALASKQTTPRETD